MSTLEEVSTRVHVSLVQPRLPRQAPAITGVIAVALGALMLVLGMGVVGAIVLAVVVYIVALPLWSLAIEGRRSATDRLMTALIWSAFGVAVVPLVSLVWRVVSKGAGRIDGTFLSYSFFKTQIDQPVGIYHAIIGTLLITLGATIISVPVGVMAAVYLVEYGKGNKLAKAITFLVDVMTGIPSIVAGLFAFALFTLIFGPAYVSGIGGSVALSLLMIPIVVRATEEMLMLVPDELREAAYALGTPKWKTIVRIVLPTALGGILTGITLAISRVIGETAPLLLIAGATDRTNMNLFDGAMTTLPVLIYGQNLRGDAPAEAIAWGAAFILIVIVMVLNLAARIVGKIFAPKKG
ncbi:phosphate ABC transporter permease PstA [Pimelobacter simplex]|uniref:Phosphate transport system permease protein PstA n=1 Tax=Nocardioides simplex TaxID=2045 RepID=A0A0A1DQW2_NOCSI|nr:phosphate ABC transporter permease PstA [Pimelobacter simplex]AIY18923.1 Phosphate transport system permease protein PstA [Pimelobacter simplex]MCG8148850.1 phosphate ABC transporter permease PstA [Pimelobacter simplex]GEB14667.1 phosphate transport system permease protein PstA [Pimelobacter simplex]SFM27031.1 phosphate ABC transporter membrane protein 2, PhoT family [Pimelobacter simplex]